MPVHGGTVLSWRFLFVTDARLELCGLLLEKLGNPAREVTMPPSEAELISLGETYLLLTTQSVSEC